VKRLVVAATCCAVGGTWGAVATAAAPPPPPPTPPKPVSLTIKKVHSNLVVVVKCKHLTRQNARANTDNLVLDVKAYSPKGEYGVQSNGPGMPVAVHPYAGPDGATSGPAKLAISVKHQTETFTFGLKAIHRPARVRIRSGNQARQWTRFYSLRIHS